MREPLSLTIQWASMDCYKKSFTVLPLFLHIIHIVTYSLN
jgi:hypothetical protein